MGDSSKQAEEQEAPVLTVFQGHEAESNDDHEPDDPEHVGQDKTEAYWAGRNHAMRRSARVAA